MQWSVRINAISFGLETSRCQLFRFSFTFVLFHWHVTHEPLFAHELSKEYDWKACVDPVCRRAEFRRPTWPWIWVCHISIIKYVVAGRSLCTIVPMLVFGASNRCTEKMLPTCRRWPEGMPAAHATSWLLEIRSRVFCLFPILSLYISFSFPQHFFSLEKKKQITSLSCLPRIPSCAALGSLLCQHRHI